MMATHTPGPWKVEWPLADSLDELPVVMGNNGKTVVCEVAGVIEDEDGPCAGYHNALLIAAAPDLLAACEVLRDAIVRATEKFHLPGDLILATELLNLAIAKARQP